MSVETGPTVAIVYTPDDELGPDPRDDTAKVPRRQGELITPGMDVCLMWREWGDEFEGGSRIHVVLAGAWEHVTHDQVTAMLAELLELPHD